MTTDPLISVFESHYKTVPIATQGVIFTLTQFKFGNYAAEVAKVRSLPSKKDRDELKVLMPGVTFSGQYAARNLESAVAHSGFIVIDADGLHDIEECRLAINADPYTFSSFASVSGRGLAWLVKIEGSRHYDAFHCLKRYYSTKLRISIQADAAAKDPTRMRCVTHDSKLYLFPESLTWTDYTYSDWLREQEQQERQERQARLTRMWQARPTAKQEDNTAERVEKLVVKCETEGINITSNYEDWVKIGMALFSEFGEAGEEWFHRLSQLDDRYNMTAVTKKYKAAAKGEKVSIGSLFYIANQYNVKF